MVLNKSDEYKIILAKSEENGEISIRVDFPKGSEEIEIERLREGFLYFKSRKLNQLKTDETNSERPTFEVF